MGPDQILALVMYLVTRRMQDLGGKLICWALWVYGTFLGMVVYELGHALFALLFVRRILEFKLFSPDPVTGTLGYVRHSYRKENLNHQIGNFFIDIGLVILGPVVIYFSTRFLLGAEVFLPLNSLYKGKTGSEDLPLTLKLFLCRGEIYFCTRGK